MDRHPTDAARSPRAPGAGWRPVLFDGLLAALLLASSIPSWTHPFRFAAAAISACLTLPLAVRRSRPAAVAAVVTLAAFAQWLAEPEGLRPKDVAVLVAVYTVAAYQRARWWAYAALAVGLLGAVLAWLPAYLHRGVSIFGVIPLSAVVIAVWLLGRNLRGRRLYLSGLEQRAVRLEREREALARVAVAEERARIAREMHDVVAHSVSVMVAQADGAAAVMHTNPGQAQAALEVVSDVGRQALGELRRLLGVLREDPTQTVAGAAATEPNIVPQPGLRDLPALVAAMRDAGLPVRYVHEGDDAQVGPTLGLAVYRIVQESLTNALRHAGAGTATEVRVRHWPGVVDLEIANVGGSAPRSRPGGHGLVGLRERVALFSGRLTAGPTPSGWLVHAQLPTDGIG